MFEFVKVAFQRTSNRFCSLFETIQEEYERMHDFFEGYGWSLHVIDVSDRAARAASYTSVFLILATLPVIFYYRGISEPELFFGLTAVFAISWLLFYILVLVAHFLWALAFIAGSKVGGSDVFLNYVGKRWGKHIDQIYDSLVAQTKADACELEKTEIKDDKDSEVKTDTKEGGVENPVAYCGQKSVSDLNGKGDDIPATGSNGKSYKKIVVDSNDKSGGEIVADSYGNSAEKIVANSNDKEINFDESISPTDG